MVSHRPSCDWYWDQYDWECTCGAIENPEALKPRWISEWVERTRRLSQQPQRKVSEERRATARAFLSSAMQTGRAWSRDEP